MSDKTYPNSDPMQPFAKGCDYLGTCSFALLYAMLKQPSLYFAVLYGLLVTCFSLTGCGSGDDYSQSAIKFLDTAPANTTSDEEFGQLVFQDLDAKDHSLSEYSRGKSLVLVITRGNTAYVCAYCSTQVARLIRDYKKITELNAEIVVVYPVEEVKDGEKIQSLLLRSREELKDPNRQVPFPIVLDARLVNVDKLGIRKDLSKPATYILDPAGRVRYAYVGESLADRPSVEAIVSELKKLKK